jgi:lipase
MDENQATGKSSDPFAARFEVPVAGGALNVARAGPPPHAAEAIVLAVHGVAGSHMVWRTVAREIAGRSRACLLAPDLRGRGRSARLPDPFGMATHISDLIAVLDHAGAERAVLVGHSMGAYIAARLATEQSGRAAGLVLLDAGLPMPASLHRPDDEPGPADDMAAPMEASCRSSDQYLARWRAHPAFARAWDDDVEAYARYDMVEEEHAVRCVVCEDAVMTDNFDLLFDGTTRKAITRVRGPIRLLRAPRGPLDDDCAVIPGEYLQAFAAEHPHLVVEHVADTNHYTLVLGPGPGPSRVADAIRTVISEAALAPLARPASAEADRTGSRAIGYFGEGVAPVDACTNETRLPPRRT